MVSRIDITTYSHCNLFSHSTSHSIACAKLLSIQIDAAINTGNSGGPAILGNKLIGVAFESLVEAENIGYIVRIKIFLFSNIDTNSHYRALSKGY